jgi:hypothetical protein
MWTSVSVVGLIAIALGLLWFLQGSTLVRIDPIACASNCEPMVGHQPAWQAAGAITVIAGALAAIVAVRRMRG